MPALVVKIGGSLFDWPLLRTKLSAWLGAHVPLGTMLVPGGGPFADGVRAQDADDETAHWLALESMSQAAGFLREILGVNKWSILDAYAFCAEDEFEQYALPHSWNVTSDSVAARAAERFGAELMLLKSTDPPHGTIADWAAAGYVDRYFPTIATRANLKVQAVNLRAY